MPGGVELLLITILALVIVFFTFAIKRGWYNQVFVVVVTLLGLLSVALGVIKLIDDVEENNIAGGLQVFVGLLMLLFSGYLQKKLAADKGEK
ncbi:MAG: hypothetical protein VCD34_01260 [Planctomycetota bacterium]